MLTQQINEDMKTAMKSGDKGRLSAIRMLRAAIKDKEIELGRAAADDDVFALIAKMVKQRKEAAAQYDEAGRDELKEKELAEAEVLLAYLPEQLGEAEIKALVDAAIAEAGATGMVDMGKVMGIVRPKAQGRADMGMLSALVKAALQSL